MTRPRETNSDRDPTTEIDLIEELEDLRRRIRADKFDSDAQAERARHRRERLVTSMPKWGRGWDDIAAGLGITREEAEQLYGSAMRRRHGTKRLGPNGGALTPNPYRVVIAHRREDPKVVRAWIEPTPAEQADINQDWVERNSQEILAADYGELCEVVFEEVLHLEALDSPFEVSRALRSAAAVRHALHLDDEVEIPWRPDEFDHQAASLDTLTDLVETVYDVLGWEEAKAQAEAVGINFGGRRPA